MIRFLFGDIRVDIWLDVEEIRLPEAIQKEADRGREIDALYQFEVLASPRGKLWYLTRRVAEEDSVACLRHKSWIQSPKPCSLYLSTVFLAKRARVKKDRPSLAYSLTLGVRVPDYEIERKLWIDEHYEGGYLFRDSVVIEIFPPQNDGEDWKIVHDWQRDDSSQVTTTLPFDGLKKAKVDLPVAFASNKTPGVRGKLRFIVSNWNG